ncbi:hypothetical protein A2982_02725 [candidate division WWE3 bacterium RIFCSPLOWO2_01_FULL_39_13]|uniref:Abortive infection protein AbiEi n=1 Tax=candidate division WWE3 bacterium RIFCSPLOWO2_01_FULL_39_13 TaxID=1802624 RepID=A0A1F4V2P8_UNCKA|nr:MAG: hypothetical protein A2982_02725 [candidate division WWE3 bacterium RIFCSPLOWO2_01_FULL_39_13]
MYTLPKPIQVREELLKRKLRIFSAGEFMDAFNTTPYPAKYFLETQVQQGLLARLKRGIYTLKTDMPSEEEIANTIYKPSYISFEYALAHYHLLPEMPYVVTSATTKPTRLFTTTSSSFSYRTIKREAYTGYALVRQDQKSFLIADKEKALIDYLYFFILQKCPENERLFKNLRNKSFYKTEDLNRRKITAYARLFKNERLLNLINQFR